MSFKLSGGSGLKATLTTAARHAPAKVGGALKAEAEIEMTESKQLVPVDKGILRASGYVAEPEVTATSVSVEMGYGGAAADYAVPVHEDLEAFHTVGQAKYLEQPLLESAPHMPDRLGRRLDVKDLVE